MASLAHQNTRSKTSLQEERSKDPNAGIFTDTSGRISKNVYLDWSIIYSTFNNDDLSALPNEQLTYINIKSSQLHLIAARPPFMPYTNAVKWALDHANPEERVFSDHIGVFQASFKLDIFSKAYALGLPKQLLNRKFLDEEISHFNYKVVVKSWMENPTVFISQPGNIYPTSWFREPFSLLASMFCRLYGEANCTFFKEKWVSTARHIILIRESFNLDQILSVNLQEKILQVQSYTCIYDKLDK